MSNPTLEAAKEIDKYLHALNTVGVAYVVGDIEKMLLKHFPLRPEPKGLDEAVKATFQRFVDTHNPKQPWLKRTGTTPYPTDNDIKSILLAHLPMLDEGCVAVPVEMAREILLELINIEDINPAQTPPCHKDTIKLLQAALDALEERSGEK